MKIQRWLIVGIMSLAASRAAAEAPNLLARQGIAKLSDKIYAAGSCKRLVAPNGTKVVEWTCLRERVQGAVAQAWRSFTQDSGSFWSGLGAQVGFAGKLVAADYPGLGLDDVKSMTASITKIKNCPADIGKGASMHRDAACVDAAVERSADHLWRLLAKLDLDAPDSPAQPGCVGPVAVDGQSLWCQDEKTIRLFIGGYKEDAAERWAWEHSRDLDVRQGAWRRNTYGSDWESGG